MAMPQSGMTLCLLFGWLTAFGQTILEPRIVSETLPSGGLMQIKLDVTSPHPITVGRPKFVLDGDFDGVDGVSIFSPGGDAYGVAVVLNQRFTAHFISPQASLGTQLNYPYLVIATRIKPGLPTGKMIPINFDEAATFFVAPGGANYSVPLPKNGILTIGGSIAISNVVPGGGSLPSGSVIRLLGTGFTTQTTVAVDGVLINNLTFVSPTEMSFVLGEAADLTSRRIRAKNRDNFESVYYSYLRDLVNGTSTRPLLNACHPVFANLTVTSVGLTIPAAPANGFNAVTLRNSSFAQIEVQLELVSPFGSSLARTSVTLPATSRHSRTILELFGVDASANSQVRITSAAAIQVMGLTGDDSLGTVTAFAAGPLGAAQMLVNPASLQFDSAIGGAAPSSQNVNATSVGGALAFSATSSASWLSVSQIGTSTPASLTASVNPAGLAAGVYNTTITVTPVGAPPATIPVTLSVGTLSTLPGAPGNVSPTPGATGVALNGILNWTAASGATSYDIRFGSTNPPLQFVTTIGLTAAYPALLAGQTYFWQVVARNGAGTTPSPVWQFSTASSSSSGLVFVPVAPCRLVDTRLADGPLGGPLMTALSTRTFALQTHACVAPANPEAYSLNITVVPRGVLGFITVWPAGVTRPLASTLNSDGRAKANAAIVQAGVNRSINVYATEDTQVIIDINGYFVTPSAAPSNGLSFYPVTPCRIIDTRDPTGALGGPALFAQQPRSIPVRSSACGIPATAQAYALNATVVPQTPVFSFLSLWQTGSARPVVSTLNAVTGTVTANAAILPAGINGEVSVYATDNAHLVLDINGYFAPPGAAGALTFQPAGPCRILDTRLTPNGPDAGPVLTATQTRDLAVPVCSGGSANARAYSLNATVVPNGIFGYLTMWPTGSPQATVSTLNAVDGAVTSNAAIVSTATPGGMITLFGSNTVHLVLDLNGYFVP